MKLQQVQLCIPANAVMNGFCWAFSNALLSKMRDMHAKKQLVASSGGFTRLGESVAHTLCGQICYEVPHTDCVEGFIEDAEEFLSIFKKD